MALTYGVHQCTVLGITYNLLLIYLNGLFNINTTGKPSLSQAILQYYIRIKIASALNTRRKRLCKCQKLE